MKQTALVKPPAAKADTEVREQDLIKCGACGTENCYIQHNELVCRECGEENKINLAEIPTVQFIRSSIWHRVGQDIKAIEKLKEDFLFSESSSDWKRYACYYDILIFLKFGPWKQQ